MIALSLCPQFQRAGYFQRPGAIGDQTLLLIRWQMHKHRCGRQIVRRPIGDFGQLHRVWREHEHSRERFFLVDHITNQPHTFITQAE